METKFFFDMSEEELHDFAVSLVKTINSEKLFSDDISFEFASAEVDEFNGGLWIELASDDTIEVERPASWQASDEDEIEEADDIDFANSIYKDVANMFKATHVEVEGYKVELDVTDVGDSEITEVIPGRIRHEDSGIGSYEYGGIRGYDSNPYVETDGTIIESCYCYLNLFVEPIDQVSKEPEEEI
jgi:hypothetical protein